MRKMHSERDGRTAPFLMIARSFASGDASASLALASTSAFILAVQRRNVPQTNAYMPVNI